MNREIKFRALVLASRLDNLGPNMNFAGISEYEVMIDVQSISFANGKVDYVIDSDGSEYSGPQLKTVMQYTGLKDKNGKEIFEGDIVKQTYHTQTGHVYDGTDMTFDGHHTGTIVITARGVCMKNPLHYSEDTDETNPMNAYKQVAGYRSEVIGNIHENPEVI